MEIPSPIPLSGSVHSMLRLSRIYHWSPTRLSQNPWGPTPSFLSIHKLFYKTESYIKQVLSTALDREHDFLDSFLTLQSLYTLPTRDNRLDIYTRFLRHVNQGEITTRPLQCSTSTQLHPLRFNRPVPCTSRRPPLAPCGFTVASFPLLPTPHSPDGEATLRRAN